MEIVQIVSVASSRCAVEIFEAVSRDPGVKISPFQPDIDTESET